MVGRLSRCMKQLESRSTQRKLIVLVKENRGANLRAVDAGSWPRGRVRLFELRLFAPGEEPLQPLMVFHQLNELLLRNDFRCGFFPKRYSPRMIAVSVRQNDISHRRR